MSSMGISLYWVDLSKGVQCFKYEDCSKMFNFIMLWIKVHFGEWVKNVGESLKNTQQAMCTSKYSSVSPVRYCFKQTRLNRTYGFTITSICQLSCSNKYLKSLPIDLHFDLVNNTENNYQLKTCCKMLNTKNSFLNHLFKSKTTKTFRGHCSWTICQTERNMDFRILGWKIMKNC